jgi:SAM-dependent methyltransferase
VRGYDEASYGEAMADVYDDWYGAPGDTAAAVRTLRDLAGAGPVLELGVGTGRLALPLAGEGLTVHGLDASPAMLDRLRAKPGAGAVHLHRGDMAADLPAGKFALVFVAVNTLFGLPTAQAQQRCFDEVARRLAPRGRFVVEAFVPTDPPPAGSFVDVRSIETDRVVLTVSSSDPGRQVSRGQFVELTDGQPVRLRPFEIRWATPAQLDAYATAAGLELEARWAGWDREPFGQDSASHVTVYRNPG